MTRMPTPRRATGRAAAARAVGLGVAAVLAATLAACSLGVSDRTTVVRQIAGLPGMTTVAASTADDGTVAVDVSLERGVGEADLAAIVSRWIDASQNIESPTSLHVAAAPLGGSPSTLDIDSGAADPAALARAWIGLDAVASVSISADAEGATATVAPLQPRDASPSAVADLAGSTTAIVDPEIVGTWTFTVGAVSLLTTGGAPVASLLTTVRGLDDAWDARPSSSDTTLDISASPEDGLALDLDLAPADLADLDDDALLAALPADGAWTVATALDGLMPEGATLDVTAFGGDEVAGVGDGRCEGPLAAALDPTCS